MVKRSNVIDNLVFSLSPFKTSCFAVDGKLSNATWSAKFYGNFLKCDLSHENHYKDHRNCCMKEMLYAVRCLKSMTFLSRENMSPTN